MKKGLKITLIVFVVIAVVLGALAVWQWSNIKAVFMSFKYSSEEINALVAENEEETDRILKKITTSDMRHLTDEELSRLQSGELSEESALDLIKGCSESDNADGEKSEGKSGKTSDVNYSAKASGSKIDDIIARIYLLRAEYVGALAGLESEAASYVRSIPSKEWNVSKKLEVVDTFTGRAAALEVQCDARMNSLIRELEAELRRTGGNVGIISEVESVYAAEKELKKSQFLSKYGKYL